MWRGSTLSFSSRFSLCVLFCLYSSGTERPENSTSFREWLRTCTKPAILTQPEVSLRIHIQKLKIGGNTHQDLFNNSAQFCSIYFCNRYQCVGGCVCVCGARSCNTATGPSESRWPRRRAEEAHVAGLLLAIASQWSHVYHSTLRPQTGRPSWWETDHRWYTVMEDVLNGVLNEKDLDMCVKWNGM